MLGNVIKKLFPIRDEKGRPCTFPTFASQVFFDDGSVLEGKQFGGGTATVDPLTIYPVGSIYMSVNSASPASLFGGTWAQIKGRFLFGTGLNEANTTTEYGSLAANWINRTAGEMGGEIKHALTTTEQPSHRHDFEANVYARAEGGSETGFVYTNTGTIDWGTPAVTASGGGESHNNMPPYLAVYMWKRVS